MRVCHVISGDLWAGAETMCLRLITGLAEKKGVELSAILMNEGKLAREIRRLDIPIEIVRETELDIFRATRRVQKILMSFRPDILHTHRLKENSLAFLASKMARRSIFLICTQHGLVEPQSSIKWKLLSGVDRYLLSRHFERVVAVSEDMRLILLEKHGFPSRTMVVIHNGTEIRNSSSLHLGNRPFTIGSAGRLFPVKDYPFFLKVAMEINRSAKDIRFELAGDGPDLGKLRDQVLAMGLQDVFCFKGFVEDISGFYTGLDLYINTSLHEGFPMSVLEAMSHGLPVVAPVEGGIKEAVTDGLEGFLVGGRDPVRYAQKCLEIYKDQELRIKMGVASREKVARNFSIPAMTEKYNELYKHVLSKPGSARFA